MADGMRREVKFVWEFVMALVRDGWLAAALLGMLLIICAAEMWHQRQLLRNNQQRYWWVLTATNMYVFEYPLDADVINLSSRCARLLEVPQQIYQYTLVARYTRDKRMQRGMQCIRQVVHTEEGQTLQVELERPDGSFGIYRAHSHGFYDERGQLISIVGLLVDITQEVQEERNLRTRAELDGLTQIYNSGTIRHIVETSLRQRHPQEQSAFVMLDVDYFKRVNDTYGHQVGDRVLKTLASGLQGAVRAADLLGRLGGDEFCIYLPHIPDKGFLQKFCERLNEVARQQLTVERAGCACTISVGAAIVHPEDDFAAVYNRADQALYLSKTKGRNTNSVQV